MNADPLENLQPKHVELHPLFFNKAASQTEHSKTLKQEKVIAFPIHNFSILISLGKMELRILKRPKISLAIFFTTALSTREA